MYKTRGWIGKKIVRMVREEVLSGTQDQQEGWDIMLCSGYLI